MDTPQSAAMTVVELAPYAGLAASLAVAAGLIAVMLWVRSLRARLSRTETALAELQAEVGALCAAASGADRRILQLERGLRRLEERQDRMELTHGGERAYDHAIRLVRSGAGVERLVTECGLTLGEARLILMLHGDGAREATPPQRTVERARA